MYFTAQTDNDGREIWVSNGTENGTYLLKDIFPGRNGSSSKLFNEISVVFNNSLYFVANDGTSNGEIWKTDGTREGTVKVTRFLDHAITDLTVVGDQIYFIIKEKSILHVWKTDGTEAGTTLVLGDIPYITTSYEGKVNDTFIFTFRPPAAQGSRVWRSDGTAAGTYPITEVISGNGGDPGGTLGLTQYIEYHNELYFNSRHALHKTDGTLENTTTITDLFDITPSLVNYAGVIEANDKLYYTFYAATAHKLDIWESDGTEAGTIHMYGTSSNSYFLSSNLLAIPGHLVFVSKNQNGGSSLFKLDVETYIAEEIKEVVADPEQPFIFTNTTNLCRLYDTGTDEYYLIIPTDFGESTGWATDLTDTATVQLEGLNNSFYHFVYAGDLYFSKTDYVIGLELGTSDGTEPGTFIFYDIDSSPNGMSNSVLYTVEDKLVFNVSQPLTGFELYVYDGISTSLLKDIWPGHYPSFPNNFITFHDELYFAANDSIHGIELWKTNGTPEGTNLVVDIIEGIANGKPRFLTVFKDELYFIADRDNKSYLCKLQDTLVEFITHTGTTSNNFPYDPFEVIVSGDFIYFLTDAWGEDLWQSDGTADGTFKLRDLSECEKLTDVNGHLFFTAYDSTGTRPDFELWTTDGTTAGTVLVKDIGIEYASSPDELYAFKNKLFFTAYTREDGREVWQSDGTENGTVVFTHHNPSSIGSVKQADFCTLGNNLLFTAYDEEHGMELWKTDGTEIGTRLIEEINAGKEGSYPGHKVVIQDQVYYQAYTEENGMELWASDGTHFGTKIVTDILPGQVNSNPEQIVGIGDEIFFMASTPSSGRQVWKLNHLPVKTIEAKDADFNLSIYPNPSSDYIYFDQAIEVKEVKVYNANAQLLSIEKIAGNRLCISNYASGHYTLVIETEDGVVAEGIVKI